MLVPPPPARAHDRAAGPVSRLGATTLVRRLVATSSRPSSRATSPIAHPARWARRRRRLGEGEARPLRPRGGEDAWDETIPGLGRVRLRNLVTVVPGSTADAILVLAHRDDIGVGPGANDNASGTAALIELARGYGRLGTVAGRPKPQHTLIFLSSDGGAYGGFGAERFASTSPLRDGSRRSSRSTGSPGPRRPRLELAGFEPRSPAPALSAHGRCPGRRPARPAAGARRLARPARRPRHAVRLRRAGAVPRPQDLGDPPRHGAATTTRAPRRTPRRASIRRGSSASAGPPSRSWRRSTAASSSLAGRRAHVYLGRPDHPWLGDRARPADALIPFLVGAIDLFARSRRRRLPLPRRWRALRTRFGVWLWIGAPRRDRRSRRGVSARLRDSRRRRDSPAVSRLAGGRVSLASRRCSRHSAGGARAPVLVPLAPAADDEVLAGYAVALVALGGVAIATALVSPYGLLFVVPSLYAWLWLPQVERRSAWARDVLYGVGPRRARARRSSRSAPSSGSGSTPRSTSSR